MTRRGGCLVLVLAGLLPLMAAADDAPAGACPLPVQVAPVYPPDLIRRGKSGMAVVAYRMDDCGRVLEARIDKSSGHAPLDAEALRAVEASVMPGDQHDAAAGGWHSRELVFAFDTIEDAPLQQVSFRRADWPKTHRRPEYRLVDPIRIDDGGDIETLGSSLRDMSPGVIRPPVMNVPHSFLQVQGEAGLEFWLLLRNEAGRHVVAAHFRPVFEDERPVVDVAFGCELEAPQCERLARTLRRGRPFARAKGSRRR